MTIVVTAFNEAKVIGPCVRAALAVDYPELEVLVFDDGSTDGPQTLPLRRRRRPPAVGRARSCQRGKAARLNVGFREARHELVVVTDADTHLHPLALRLLVARLSRSPRIAAVAGAPHVTNRRNLLNAMQALEAASIIGLIRRTQALSGRVGVSPACSDLPSRACRRRGLRPVDGHGGHRPHLAAAARRLAHLLRARRTRRDGRFRAASGRSGRSAAVGAWAGRGAARAFPVGAALAQPTLVAAGDRSRRPLVHGDRVRRCALAATVLVLLFGESPSLARSGFAWGIAVAVVATLQLAFALSIDSRCTTAAPRSPFCLARSI